jgi:hypothetical protein
MLGVNAPFFLGLYRMTKESGTGDGTLDEAVIIPDVAERLKALDGLPAVYQV